MVNDGQVLIELQAKLDEEITPKLKNIEEEIENIGNTSKKNEPSLSNFPKKLGDNCEETKLKVENLKKSIATLGTVSKVTFTTISASAGIVVKKYIDLESGILKVRTISNKSFEEIKKTAQDLATKYGISTNQILEGNYQLVSSMGDVSQSQEILDTTAKLSIAGFTNYADAMNGLVAVLNGYKMEADQASDVANKLMIIQNRGITTVNELQGSLAEVTSIAYNANVSFNDIAAALATITSNKVETAEAITGLKGAISELMQDGSQASKIFKEATGEAFDVFMNNHNLLEAIQILNDYAKNTGISLINIFGNIKAGTAFMNLAGDNLKKFNSDMKAITESSGTVDKALEELEKGGARAFLKLKEEANVAAQKIGEALNPQVKELTTKLHNINWESVFSQENINKIIKTGKEILIVSGTIWGINKAIKAVETSIIAAKGLKELLKILGGGSVATGGAITSGIASIGYIGYKFVDMINEKQKSATESLKEQLSILKNDEKKEYLEEELRKSKLKIKKMSSERNSLFSRRANKNIVKLENERQRVKALEKAYKELNNIKDKETSKKQEEIKEIKKDEKKKISFIPARESGEILKLKKELDDFNKNQPKIWDLLGLDEKQKIEEKVNFLKSALKKAVEIGATNLIPVLKKQLDIASNNLKLVIKNVDFDNAKIKLEKKLKSIQGDGISNLGKLGIEKDKAKYNAISEFLEEVGEGTNLLQKEKIKELKIEQEMLSKKIKLENDEQKARIKYIETLNSNINALNNLSGIFNQLSNITGSKRLGIVGNMLGSAANLGEGLKSFGKISDITNMFSGGIGALGTGLASIGSIAGIATGGIGIIAGIGNIFGSKGKKKKAEIEAKNQENKNKYNEQVKAMEQLTQAILKNSERIKTFSDRLITDIAKSPTLNKINGGIRNYDIIYDSLVQGKHFNDISALEVGSKKYRSGFKKKRKTTYTQVDISEKELLKYLGWEKTELDNFSAEEMKQLNSMLNTINHDTLRKATGRDLSESNIEEWKKQISIFNSQLEYIEKEKEDFFNATTLENFNGINYLEEKELIKEYTESFKEMGLEGEQYNETIKELAKNNQVLVTSMEEVRNTTIDSWLNGTGGFVTSMKSYFEKIFKNAGSIVYDVMFSDLDNYFTEKFEQISKKLLDMKKNQKLDFVGLFDDFDFDKLKLSSAIDIQAKKALDVLKSELYNHGVDLSIINQILPLSDFNEQINHLKDNLQNAMNSALNDNNYMSFTKTLGQQLYDNLKNALTKAFSESQIYQSMIQKFIKVDDFKKKFEEANSFKEVFDISQNILKQFGYELEAGGFGGFDAINNIAKENTLGNAYYTDKAQNVNINITNNFYKEIYGIDDFKQVIKDTTKDSLEEFMNRPKVIA